MNNTSQVTKIWVYDQRVGGYGVQPHFQQYFSFIVAVSFIGGENHRPVASQWQTWSHNVVSSTPRHKQD
jgi:hypothetical protein